MAASMLRSACLLKKKKANAKPNQKNKPKSNGKQSFLASGNLVTCMHSSIPGEGRGCPWKCPRAHFLFLEGGIIAVSGLWDFETLPQASRGVMLHLGWAGLVQNVGRTCNNGVSLRIRQKWINPGRKHKCLAPGRGNRGQGERSAFFQSCL